jgi:citrate synthase
MSNGLDGVVVADTVLSQIDPPNGRLWIRGVSLPELLASHGYEGTVALLWQGFAGDGLDRPGMQATLGVARQAAFANRSAWLPEHPATTLEAGVRRMLAALPDDSPPAAIAASLTVGVAALVRQAVGNPPVPPDPTLPVATDLLRMLHGVMPDAAAAQALDTYFTAMADSGMSASSFTARVVASTRASVAAAVLGAWCAFTGPLHGGAPGPTLDLLDALAATDDMDGWIEQRLRAGERLMGFGHRVYRGNDPRAAAMRASLQKMGPLAGRLAFAARVEERVAAVVERVKPGRRLPANVEIMAALLLDAVGIPRTAFTAVFAVSRCASWIAHALEQQQTGRMFRPESRYVGPAPA